MKSNNKIIIRKMKKSDDFFIVGRCLILADKENYPPLNINAETMGELIKTTSYFSYKNIFVITFNNQIIGALLYFDKKTKFDEENILNILKKDFHFDLNAFEHIKKGYFIPALDFHEDIYLFNIGVLDEYQSKGYGNQLLSYFLFKFKNKSISLECLSNNKRAFNFYKSFGFIKQFSFKTYSYLPFECTSFHMVKDNKKEMKIKNNKATIIIFTSIISAILIFLVYILIKVVLNAL